jgi:hypothetical protein
MTQPTKRGTPWIWLGCLGAACCLCSIGAAVPVGILAVNESVRIQIGSMLGFIPPTETPTAAPARTATPTVTLASTHAPPGGGRILFASDRSGDAEIYAMDPDGGNAIRLTYSPGDDYHPVASADGKWIAFVSLRDGNPEIYRMDADGTNPVRLTFNDSTDYFPSRSPDSSRIAYETYRQGNYEIFVMDSDG